MKTLKFIIASSALVLCFGLIAFMVLQPLASVSAAPTGFDDDIALEGWAWSSNIGWISMSCENTNTCGASNYGVKITSAGNLTGYAWSDNIGWIKFGGLSGFPNGRTNSNTNARVDGTFPNLTLNGWARACAGTTSGNCSNMTSRTDGWDGWIALKGQADNGVNYSISLNATGASSASYAWGSDVVGAISFSNVLVNLPDPVISTFTVNPAEVTLGNTTAVSYTVRNATSCTASNNRSQSDWSGSVNRSGATYPVTPPVDTTVYTLSCTNGVTAVNDTVTVTARPNIVITAFSMSNPGTPPPNGIYSTVTFIADARDVPTTGVPYQLTFQGQTPLAGIVRQVGSSLSFTPPLRYNNVLYGDRTAQLTIDLPTPGTLPEDIPSTAANEDTAGNTSAPLATELLAPPPTIIVTGDSIVRSNKSATFTYSIQAPYVANCTLIGQGVNESITTSGVYTTPTTGTVTSTALSSTSEFLFTCSYPEGTHTEKYRVEVVPEVEEI